MSGARSEAAPLNTFDAALEHDTQGVIDVLDIARQIWEPAELVAWMKAPQSRWAGESPLTMIVAGKVDDVLDLIEGLEQHT